jgi:radical SAM protein with 4Fe4S-binding SPASM domain
MNSESKTYKKEYSFNHFVSYLNQSIDEQRERVVALLQADQSSLDDILQKVLEDLSSSGDVEKFSINQYSADELSRIQDEDVPRYISHRYRYDMYPKKHLLDSYPPYVQIEPASVCNFRCVFCYQTDKEFTQNTSGHMGFMDLDLFKNIVDQIEGEVEFLSLASRGEPLLCKDIGEMLSYCKEKFLGLKLNTNASVLDKELCHAILKGGVNTLVFSVDAANAELFNEFRVNGDFESVYQNIKLFSQIKKEHYPESKLITRVSGVKYSDAQNMEEMMDVWSSLVDQISFVEYNPWENVYSIEENDLSSPCSDLWRRMFIWHDGRVNPCDTDYKTTLSWANIKEKDVSEIWISEGYSSLREQHLQSKRVQIEPCKRCKVI